MTQPVFIVSAILWTIAFIAAVPGFAPEPLWRLGCVAALFISAFLILSQSKSLPRGGLAGAALLFWLNAAASVVWSDMPFVSFIALCTFSLFPAGFFAYSQSGLPAYFYRICAIGGGLVLAALALWAAAQYFFLPDRLVYGQARHPFADPNSYAMLLLLGFFPGCGLMLSGQNRVTRNAGLLLALLTLAGILIIGSRGVTLALLSGLGLFLFLTRAQIGKHKRCWLVLAASCFAVLAAASFLKPDIAQAPAAYVTSALANPGLFFGTRLAIWQGTMAIAAAHAPFGTGIGTFFLYYPQYRPAADIYSAGITAHNDPLQFLTEMGVLAPPLFYLFAALALKRMVRYLRNIVPGRDERIMPSALFCAFGALVFHTHFSFDFYIPPVLVLSGLMLGWWYRQTAAGDERTFTLSVSARAVWQGAMVCLLVGALFVLQGFLRSIDQTDRAEAALQSGQIELFEAAAIRAGQAAFGLNAKPYVQMSLVPIGMLATDGIVTDPEETQKLRRRAAALLDRAERLNPRLVSVHYNRADLARSAGDDTSAAALLEKALALNPLYLPARMALADIYESQGRRDETLAVLKEGLHWPYLIDPLPYYTRLSFLALSLGDRETHRLAQEKMTERLLQNQEASIPVMDDSTAGGL